MRTDKGQKTSCREDSEMLMPKDREMIVSKEGGTSREERSKETPLRIFSRPIH